MADPRRVQHTVKSLRPHGSIVIADVTAEPTRAQRLATTQMDPKAITRARTLLRDSVGRALGDLLPPAWHRRAERAGAAR